MGGLRNCSTLPEIVFCIDTPPYNPSPGMAGWGGIPLPPPSLGTAPAPPKEGPKSVQKTKKKRISASPDPSWEKSGKKSAKSSLPHLPRDPLMWVSYSKYHIELNIGKSRFSQFGGFLGSLLVPFGSHLGYRLGPK